MLSLEIFFKKYKNIYCRDILLIQSLKRKDHKNKNYKTKKLIELIINPNNELNLLILN